MGKFFDVTGGMYEGSYRFDKRAGRGKLDTGQKLYDGEWNNDMPDGVGTVYYDDKTRYEGEWKLGKRTGRKNKYSSMNQ